MIPDREKITRQYFFIYHSSIKIIHRIFVL